LNAPAINAVVRPATTLRQGIGRGKLHANPGVAFIAKICEPSKSKGLGKD
jgi:hypothetical protein